MEDTANADIAGGVENVTTSGTGDFNSGVESATTETNTSGDVSNTGENLTNAEATDGEGEKTPQHIPYDRFKEVNSERQYLKTQSEQLQAKVQEYEGLFKTLQERPEIASKFFQAAPVEQVDPRIKQADETLSKQLGYVKTDQVQSMVEDMLAQREAQTGFISKIGELEKKYDGSDGMPKFDGRAVAQFMDAEGVTNPETAYQLMNLDALAESRAAKAKQKTQGTYSERPGQPMQTAGGDSYKSLLDKAKSGDSSALHQILRGQGDAILAKIDNNNS